MILRSLAACALISGPLLPRGLAADDSVIFSTISKVHPSYQRTKQGDGAFVPEYYVLANGGSFAGTTRDQTFDQVSYPKFAQVLITQLARQNYRLARKADDAGLLVVAYWGRSVPLSSSNFASSVGATGHAMTALQSANNDIQLLAGTPASGGAQGTQGGGGAAMAELLAQQRVASELADNALLSNLLEQKQRERINERNALLLGYLDEINRYDDNRRFAGGGATYNDLIADVEDSRYYIVLVAYDFASAKKEKMVLRWLTRISVSSQGTGFDQRMETMLANASRLFGQDSQGLKRQLINEGRVEIGDLKVLGTVPPPAPKSPPEDKKP